MSTYWRFPRPWAFLALCQVSVAISAAQSLDYSLASPSAAQIDQYLSRKKSPMAGMGNTFADYGRDYAVDPRLVVAISGAETSFGTHVCAANNSWNWFHHGTCPASPFANYPQGDERVTRFLRLSYINKGYDSIPLIRKKYCAAGCENWIPLVTAFFNEMPVNPSPTPAPPPVLPVPAPRSSPPVTAPVSRAPVSPTPVSPVPPISSAVPADLPVAPEDVSSRKPGRSGPPSPAHGGPGPAASDSGKGILGVPLYVVIILGVLAIGAWVTSGTRRSREHR